MVCFERELAPDWPRMARVLRDQVRHKEVGAVFWNFLDFVVTQRTPLYVLLLPFIGQKVRPVIDVKAISSKATSKWAFK